MRLIIVEDDPILHDHLKSLLSGEAGVDLVGVFGNAEEALAVLKKIRPDVMLTDIGLPGMSGVELIQKARKELPHLDILAHTIFEDRETVFSTIKAGASGYILKGCSPRELIESLQSLSQGGAPMTPKIARRLVREFQDADAREEFLLTPREKEILSCLEKGFAYKELAAKLAISRHTVHTHIKKIYEKLHAMSRADALSKARKKGIL